MSLAIRFDTTASCHAPVMPPYFSLVLSRTCNQSTRCMLAASKDSDAVDLERNGCKDTHGSGRSKDKMVSTPEERDRCHGVTTSQERERCNGVTTSRERDRCNGVTTSTGTECNGVTTTRESRCNGVTTNRGAACIIGEPSCNMVLPPAEELKCIARDTS